MNAIVKELPTAEKAPEKNIYQKIHAIMEEVSFIEKSQPKKVGDEQGLGYSYVKHDDVTKVIHKALVTHRLNIIPTVMDAKLENFTATSYNYKFKKDITKTVYSATVLLKIVIVNIDNPKEMIETQWTGFGMDTQDKAIGKAYSYAYKYALLKTFALETGDEDVESEQVDYVRGMKGTNVLDDQARAEANEVFFEQTKEKLMSFDEMKKMQDFWVKNWEHICKLDSTKSGELINIKNNMKLKIEGKL